MALCWSWAERDDPLFPPRPVGRVGGHRDLLVPLAWIWGSVALGQSFSPSVSWTLAEAGTYTATTFAWESVSNPDALSPPASLEISVS